MAEVSKNQVEKALDAVIYPGSGRSIVSLGMVSEIFIADGKAYFSITVPAGWNVQDFGRRLDASIRISGFTPLPLDGAHDAAFAVSAIPLGAGLPKKR